MEGRPMYWAHRSALLSAETAHGIQGPLPRGGLGGGHGSVFSAQARPRVHVRPVHREGASRSVPLPSAPKLPTEPTGLGAVPGEVGGATVGTAAAGWAEMG